jgi:hypothetical protein
MCDWLGFRTVKMLSWRIISIVLATISRQDNILKFYARTLCAWI